MKTKTLQLILSCALAAAAASPALAQTAAPPASSNDPVVQARMGQREANAAYASGLIKAHADRSAKVHAAVEAAVKEADEKGKDPLVAKRDADAKARRRRRPSTTPNSRSWLTLERRPWPKRTRR